MELLLSNYLTIILLIPLTIEASYEHQPQILNKNGGLILQAAQDQNISLRLSQGSSLLFNNIDITEKIRQRYVSSNPSDGDATKEMTSLSIQSVTNEIHKLQDDIFGLFQRFSNLQNNSRSPLQLRGMRQYLRRLHALMLRLSVLEENIGKNECTESNDPCRNGGTCYDLYKGYHCECPDGWKGKTCEEDVDECYLLAGTDLGCQNNAICTNTPGSYRCQCTKGFSGTHCRLHNTQCQQYQSEELCGHGSCVPANNPQGYNCICDQGWTKNTTLGINATAALVCDVDVDECEESKNPCHAECINLPGSFKCGPCPAGYTGNGMNCYDIDECATNNGGCSSMPLVRCINTEGSYLCGKCPPGWIGDGHTCELAPTNSCDAEKICHPQAKCEFISNIATCTCAHGMFGHGFGPEGCHTNPITDSCENHICQNNGSCIAVGRSTRCLCPLGYSGALCETKDVCHPNPCENEGTCKPLADDSYKCSCPRGTTGKRCEVLRSVCSSIQRKPFGELSYPTEGATEYAPQERCAWIIRTLPGQILRLNFVKFDLEADPECSRDWLQIHDGNSLAAQLIGRFCGNELPLGGTIYSSQHVLFFWFRSDNATQKSGFHMNWTSQAHICGDTLELSAGDEGIIRSPGYPGKTTAHRDCQWERTAPFGYRFVLRIYEIQMGSSPNCTGDSFKIYDADILAKEFCTSTSPEPFRTSSNKLKLHLHTDANGSDSSFQLHYEVESAIPHCGGVFTEATGLIVGPAEPSVCLYSIKQPPNVQIRLTFMEMNLNDNVIINNCNLHSIEVFDGKTDEDSRLLITCGGNQIPDTIVSSTNYLLIRYVNQLPSKGHTSPFKIKYTRDCDFRFLGPENGIITTPNYPNPYTEHLTCTYHIYGPAGTRVLANFTDISLPVTPEIDNLSKNVSDDAVANDTLTYFEVHLSNTQKQRFYKAAPMELYSEQNKMTIVFHATRNAAKTRGIRIEYSFEENHCGGVYTEKTGIFSKGILPPETCKFIFEAPEGTHIRISFTPLTYEQSKSSIKIYGHVQGGQKFLLRNIKPTFDKIEDTYNFNQITILAETHSRWINGHYEFVNNSDVCGGNYQALYGVIDSPNWPRMYTSNLDCVWTITAPLSHKIELRVQNFTLEPDCTGDSLEIRNGKLPTSPLIGRYCGQDIPSRIPSFGNSLYLRFITDNSVSGPGFHISWEQLETGCGGKLTAYKGSIHAPQMFTIQGLGSTCDWLINVAEGSSISLNITTIVDVQTFCRRNNLRIYDGATTFKPLLKPNCSDVMKDGRVTLTSSGNQMLIVYTVTAVSGDDLPDFIIDYVTNCQMALDHIQGIIESPNFPDPYPELLNCRWDIKAGTNNKLQLAFSHFSVEASIMECEYDYVEVWDMKDEDILKKHHLCTRPNEIITSEGNHLRMIFVSDYSNSKMGFRAEYSRIGCGEILTNDFGTIKSPNYPYSGGMDCEWYIEVAPGKQIVFTIYEYLRGEENKDCSADSVTISETKKSANGLIYYCSSQTNIANTYSPTNRLYIHYLSSASRGRKYFHAMYHTREATCGGVIRGSYGSLYSPNYPQNITEEINCKWELSIPDTLSIILKFKDVAFNESSKCENSFLRISDISGKNATKTVTMCSVDSQQTSFKSTRLAIEFKTQQSSIGSRFFLQYQKSCGGVIESESGTLVAQSNEKCLWLINLPQGNTISINILELDCFCIRHQNGTKDCNVNGIMIGISREKICEHFHSNMVFQRTSLLIATEHVNLRATFSSIQNSCGGTIKATSGTLTSPNFPATYPANIECIWTITAEFSNTLQIEFEDFDMPQSEHCNEDFLEIRPWLGSNTLAIYCGSVRPQGILKSIDSIWLKFRTSEGSSGRGFKLKWSYAHLTEIVNQTRGQIQSPPLSLLHYEDEPFAWRILVPRQQYVALNFKNYRDGLKLYDGYDNTALPIEISDSPWRFVSTSNVIYFETDTENPNYFQLSWKISNASVIDTNVTTSKCHLERSIKPHASVMISSPNYPSGYESNLACDWILKPFSSVQHVVCEIYEVKLEVMDKCRADYLKISSSSDLLKWYEVAKLCDTPEKTYTPYAIYHGTPNLKLDFVTDNSVSAKGFTARLITRCGSNLTEPVGFIEGDKLLYETNCLWHITVRPGKRILLQFDFAPSMQKYPFDCPDYALIYDGFDEHAPLLPPGKICNPQNVTQIQMNSTSNYVTIQYNLSLPRALLPRRWNLTYREYSTCNEEYRLIPQAASINLTSPNYPNVPQPHTECEWRILAPRGELIDIEFLGDFHMNTKFCDKEYVELFDGATALAKSLGKYCRKPMPLKTTQNILYIHYVTDVSEPRAGFKVHLSIGKCGGTYTATSDLITSTGYPHPGGYAANTQCDYVINQPSDTRIRLIVQDIHLPFNRFRPQTKDHLEIIPIIPTESTDMASSIYVFGNTTKGTQIDLSMNKAIVRFHTFAKSPEYRGFQIKYNRFGGQCHQEFEGQSGPITLSFPRRVYYSTYCRWKITVPKGLRVRLQFLNLPDVNMANENKSITFSFYNDHESQSKISTLGINSIDSNTAILSTDNMMSVSVYMPIMTQSYTSLKAQYSSDQISFCPGNIDETQLEGHVDITNVEPHFKEPYYCRSKITLNPPETLVFNITQYEIKLDNDLPRAVYPLTFRDNLLITTLGENLTKALYPQSQPVGYWQILQTDRDKIHRLSMSYRRHACGGNFIVRNDLSIKEPEIRDPHYGAIMCMWSLSRPYYYGRMGSEYRLVGNFTFRDSCEREFIMIKEQRWKNDPVMKICRDSDEKSLDFLLKNSRTFVVYQAEDYSFPTTQFYFETKKSIICGSQTMITQATSMVEVDRQTYRNNEECYWTFFTRQGLYLQVTFYGRFFVEYSENCTRDYLEIQREQDDLWIPDVRYCGRELPTIYNATTSKVKVVFRTNENVTGDGFSFFVRSHCSLVVNVTSSEVQRINSPQFQSYRYQRRQCEYIFQAMDSDRLISVRTITSSPISIYDRSLGIRRNANAGVCFSAYKHDANGKELPATEHCASEFEERAYKYLRLTTNDIGEYTIEYSFDTCGGNITASHQIIRSLRHENPNSYADNMNCVWYVTAPPDHSIVLRFKYFETEESYDHLSVYSGRTILREKRVSMLTGNLTATLPTIIVDHNQAVINALSDASNSGKGFEALIVFIPNCNERFTLTDGNSPVNLARNYEATANGEEYMCQYRISAPRGYRIRIDIKKLEINDESFNCSTADTGQCSLNSSVNCNFVEIFDSSEASMGKFCNANRTRMASMNTTLFSSYNEALLKFVGTQTRKYSFEIILTMEKSQCGDPVDEYTLGEYEQYTLTFPPNGESTYSPNTHCTWLFKLNNPMLIRFNYIDLQNVSQVSGKCLDYIQIKGDYSTFQICGYNPKYAIMSSSITNKKLEITFHSDATNEAKGFQFITDTNKVCNRTYTDLSYNLEFSGQEMANETCKTLITVSDEYNLNLYINTLHFTYSDCSKSYFKIIDQKTNTTIYNRCANIYLPVPIFSANSTLRIEMAFVIRGLLTYSVSQRTLIPGCGGMFDIKEGRIISPNYEGLRIFTNCSWTIRVPAPNSVRLYFQSFDMGPITNCHLDNFQVYDIMTNGTQKLLKTLCGPEIPSILVSTSNEIRISSKTSPNYAGNGWTLYFNTQVNPTKLS
ncbi:cubilin homolog [Musca vetustissima]|uniref:cubilin homolog n=1 Tax=Musca vetustissima TaxID=27455 RepID=UPI002AB72F57|nr:cubilin homolog [Musca vetustissima]